VVATTRAKWRAWLAKNHARAGEAWLVLYRKDTGKPSLPYDEAVEEALCFGWIDSVVRPLGQGARAQRFSPRRPGSNVSETNRARIRKLVSQRRMTAAGLAALGDADRWLRAPPPKVAPDIERRIRADPEAFKHYRRFPEAYRRIRIAWIEGARASPEVFEARLSHFLKKTAKGERFGMVRE
jgi:uncharacterized protein YdeI (YjbR/CyaY-like superfamily)